MITYTADTFISDDKPVHIFYCAESRMIHLHTHDFWEIVYVAEGVGTHYTEDLKQVLKEGDLLILSPGVAHTITSPEHGRWVRVCNCLFKDEFFTSVLAAYLQIEEMKSSQVYSLCKEQAPFFLHIKDNYGQRFRTLVEIMYDEYIQALPGSDFILRNSLEHLLIEATRAIDHFGADLSKTTKNKEIEELLRYMDAHLDMDLTLHFLAAQVHLSREYLSRYFKQYTGKTISSYLLEQRMIRARDLLRTTSYSISDISLFCGYPSVGNFQKYFKKEFNMSPSKYRKMVQD